MSGLFDPENQFSGFMGKVGDMIILSFFWCLLTVTILPAGPACSAVYYASVKSLRSEYGIARREFFHSLRVNWKQGMAVGMLFILYGLSTYVGIVFSNILNLENTLALVYWIMVRMLALPPLLLFPWVFPLMARFTIRTGMLLKTAFYLSIRHLAITVFLLIETGLCVFCVWNVPILILILPAALALMSSYSLERVFQKYIIPEDGGKTGMWSVEDEI